MRLSICRSLYQSMRRTAVRLNFRFVLEYLISFNRIAGFTRKLALPFLTASLTAIVLSVSIANADANELDAIVLTIQGKLDNQTQTDGQKNDVIELNLDSLTKLKATTFTTDQPWTNEPREYTGVRIDTLLKHIGASSAEFEALASNDYQFTLTDIDFEKYPIIIAYKIDGEFLDYRKLGPLLIVFPFNDYPELLTEKNKAASVWQLTEIRIL